MPIDSLQEMQYYLKKNQGYINKGRGGEAEFREYRGRREMSVE